ncbi:hypothetical protein EV127DRAFT_115780 [Xylaria flabelliformis]|nr:hypothetical protein EV127DRAFT_115780 [Xylaria flabelliformis]
MRLFKYLTSGPKYNLVGLRSPTVPDQSAEACLSNVDLEKPELPRRKTWPRLLLAIGMLSLITVSYTAGLFTSTPWARRVVSLPPSSHPYPTPTYPLRLLNSTDCGRSIEEAQLNGCLLDLVTGAWMKPECYNEELEKAFLAVSDWHWYLDKDGTQEITLETYKATGGSNPVYVTVDYHSQHCAFAWQKLHHAFSRNSPIDSKVANKGHTSHCSRTMVNPPTKQRYVPFYHLFAACDYHQNFQQNDI